MSLWRWAAEDLQGAHSARHLLGIAGEAKKKAIKTATEVTEPASEWLRIKSVDLRANAAEKQSFIFILHCRNCWPC